MTNLPVSSLQWCHNERSGVWNHRRLDCLLNCLPGRRSKKTSKLHVTGLCEGNPLVTSEFPAQMASNVENASIWWRHHVVETWLHDRVPGGRLNIKMLSYQYKVPMSKVRWSHECLIFNMVICIPGKDSLYIETWPRLVASAMSDGWHVSLYTSHSVIWYSPVYLLANHITMSYCLPIVQPKSYTQ